MALQAKASQALPAVLVGEIEVPHEVLCGGLLHVQLIGVLLVEEAHFLQGRHTTPVRRSPVSTSGVEVSAWPVRGHQ